MIYKFLADYYDSLNNQDLINIYVKQITKRKKKGNIIDLGGGTGALSIILSEKGFNVTLTDIENEMLEVAYHNAMQKEQKLNLFIHNILDPLPEIYDCIILSTDVINHLKTKNEMQKAFNNIANAMDTKSVFIFDFLKKSFYDKIIPYYEMFQEGDDTFKWTINHGEQPEVIIHEIKTNDDTFLLEELLYSVSEFKTMLKLSKLKVVKKIELEERYIFIAKK
ncbi:class I SAM-dependent methyltransferase [Candidatus Izimaplasma bacterium ZiA1]|uniref:class I SAM-dependent DNA methyltransferase n=1 Tax=Candidatus Izimoplasma sp. ZiA1 TaxID=2024899 RepID=UPI00143AA8FF